MRHVRQRAEAEHAPFALERVEVAERFLAKRLAGAVLAGLLEQVLDALDARQEPRAKALEQGVAVSAHAARSAAVSKRRTRSVKRSACVFRRSAEVRVWAVALTAWVTTSAIPFTLWETCSVPLRCCWVTKVIWRAASVVPCARRRLSSVAITVVEPDSRMSVTSRFTSCTDAVTRSAKRRISLATSAKPWPCSPARLASSEPLSAKRSLLS